MSLNANAQAGATSNFKYEPMDAGTCPARLVGVANVGMHAITYKGETKPPKDQLALTYEFLDEFMKDEDGNELKDKPRWLTEDMPFLPLSSEKAKSTDRYLSIDPDRKAAGEFGDLLGTPIMVQVTQSAGKGANMGKIFNNIGGVTPMRPKEAQKAPELVNKPFTFDFYAPTREAWDATPYRVKALVRSALNYKGTAMEDWDVLDGELKDQPIKIEDAPKKVSVPVDEENW
jgi:hypothetical protein